jgi:hypothetical protein
MIESLLGKLQLTRAIAMDKIAAMLKISNLNGFNKPSIRNYDTRPYPGKRSTEAEEENAAAMESRSLTETRAVKISEHERP